MLVTVYTNLQENTTPHHSWLYIPELSTIILNVVSGFSALINVTILLFVPRVGGRGILLQVTLDIQHLRIKVPWSLLQAEQPVLASQVCCVLRIYITRSF